MASRDKGNQRARQRRNGGPAGSSGDELRHAGGGLQPLADRLGTHWLAKEVTLSFVTAVCSHSLPPPSLPLRPCELALPIPRPPPPPPRSPRPPSTRPPVREALICLF